MPASTLPATTETSGAPRRPAGGLLHPAAKPLLLGLGLLPLGALVLAALGERLGANPAEALIRGLGDWTLRMLILTLAVTPLREALGRPALARFRRMLGLLTFFYAVLHLSAYAWLDMGLDPAALAKDVVKRPFILVGALGFLGLLALAATSFDAAVRALGAARWKALHRLVYAIAGLALLHFFWMRAGKNDQAEVLLHGGLILLLLGWRLRTAWRRRQAQALR